MPVREINDDEIAFYAQNGWVKLDGLVDRQTAAELLGAGRELMARSERGWENAPAIDDPTADEAYRDFGEWKASLSDDYGFVSHKIEVEPFSSLRHSRGIGKAAHRLINRKRLTDEEIPVRSDGGILVGMLPGKGPRTSHPSREYNFHQDGEQAERAGALMIWIALDEVLPEQGGMRFLTGSHREGTLGAYHGNETTVLQRFPKLLEIYELSPVFHYQPGDATVHNSYTIHGTPENRTDRQRWSYIMLFNPGDLVSSYETGPVVYP